MNALKRLHRPRSLAVASACLVLLCGCERQAPVGPVADALEEVPSREVTGVDFTISHDGRARMRVQAPYMAEHERADSVVTVVGAVPGQDSGRVRVDVFDPSGELSAVIMADKLTFSDAGRLYDANGNVLVETPEGRTLEGEHLAWEETEGRVRTPGFVRITSPSETVQGFSLDAEEDLSTYSLARVTGQVVLEE